MNYVKRHAERAPIYLKRDECNILHAFSLYPFRFGNIVFTTFLFYFSFVPLSLPFLEKKKADDERKKLFPTHTSPFFLFYL
jgi:hypothetical protein